ncbi:5486_t:CDS:2 [Paraglomus occultum]|uniref:Altered inheritance of mitochondria protein 41 n=1 Tax=Paraglomus occultum TaxID=144539 RepID=A0A9N8WD70_9GLOM|nr:5486_t:CDS:2 [Paraglomus occultum]
MIHQRYLQRLSSRTASISPFERAKIRPLSNVLTRYITSTTTDPSSQQPPLLLRLKTDVKEAMKNKDKMRLNTVKGVLSDITYASKSTSPTSQSPIDDSSVIRILRGAIKRREESISQYTAANRLDLANNETEELEILKSYLPEQMSEEDIEAEVRKVVKQVGASSVKDVGKVMKEIKIDEEKADKKSISIIVKKVLSESQ